jgi:hypothetical protein
MQPILVVVLVALAGAASLVALWRVLGRGKRSPREARTADPLAGGTGFTQPDAARNARPARRGGKVEGDVRAFRQREEVQRSAFYADRVIHVWTFYVERYNAHGERERPVPVEMRGTTFRGSLADGDRVELHVGAMWGGTARPRAVANLTTGARVSCRVAGRFWESVMAFWKFVAHVVVLVLTLLLFVALGWVVIAVAGGHDVTAPLRALTAPVPPPGPPPPPPPLPPLPPPSSPRPRRRRRTALPPWCRDA